MHSSPAGITEEHRSAVAACVCVSPDTSPIIDGTLPTASYPEVRCHNVQSTRNPKALLLEDRVTKSQVFDRV
jgi:hypothetical protein